MREKNGPIMAMPIAEKQSVLYDKYQNKGELLTSVKKKSQTAKNRNASQKTRRTMQEDSIASRLESELNAGSFLPTLCKNEDAEF